MYSPLHVPILGLIISFSLRGCKNLQLLSGPDGGGEKSVCDLQSMGGGLGWGGRAGQQYLEPQSSPGKSLLDLVPAFPGCFSFLEDVSPIGRGEGGMDFVQMSEIPSSSACLAAFISEIRRALSPEAFNCCLTQ